MTSPAQDISGLLVTNSIGTLAGTSGWGIYISIMPDAPDTVVSCYDTGGISPNPKWLIDQPSIQIRIRGAVFGYEAAYTKAQAIKDLLLGTDPKTLGGHDYRGILQIGDIMFVSYDDKNRPILTTNWRLIKDPSSGTHRTAC